MSHIETFLSGVAWRLGAERLLRGLLLWLCGATALSCVLVLAERLVSVGAPVAFLAAGPLLAGLLAGLAAGLSRWPGRTACALEADARFRLEERVSSALAAGEGPMADLVRADAERRTQTIDLRRELPVRLPRSAQALGLLLPMLAIVLFVPPLDLLGLAKSRAERAADAKAVGAAADAARAELQSLGKAAGERGAGEAARIAEKVREIVAPLAQRSVAPPEARETVEKAESALKAAEDANKAKQRLAERNPDEARRADLNADVFAQFRRTLERLAKALPGGTGTKAAGSEQEKREKGGPTPPATPAPFVKAPEPAAKGTPPAPLETRLIEARPKADLAVTPQSTAWPYRAVVQRYFSPEE